MHDPRKNADIALHLITLLGDTLARVQAAHAKEEYALSQIISSLKFVNHTVDTWVNSSPQEEAESSQFHVYESDLSAVSKSIDAVLDEARLVRGSSKRTANLKGDNARKSKAAEEQQKKTTLERFSQALHMRPTKTVSAEERHSSFSAAHEMLLRWMESNTQRSFHAVAKDKHEKSVERRWNAARKFLDSLWTIHGNPTDSKVEDAVSGGHLIETSSEDDDSTLKLAAAVPHNSVQKNVEELQALCKLMDQRHLHSELLSPHMATSKQDHQHVGNEEELVAAESSSWLPAKACWKVLGTQVKGIMMEHETLPTVYSDLQQPLATMRLMHSIHTNIFHCHLQLVLAQGFLLKSSPRSGRRVMFTDAVNSVPVEWTVGFFLTHLLEKKSKHSPIIIFGDIFGSNVALFLGVSAAFGVAIWFVKATGQNYL